MSALVEQVQPGDQIGIIFSKRDRGISVPLTAITTSSLHEIRQTLTSSLHTFDESMGPGSFTDAILEAQDQLQQFPTHRSRAMILVSPGMHATNFPQQTSSFSQLLDSEIALYGVGYSSRFNQKPLSDLSQRGNFLLDPGALAVSELYERLAFEERIQFSEKVIGNIQPGSKFVDSFNVNLMESHILVRLTKFTGDLQLALVRPDGSVVDFNTDPSVSVFESRGIKQIRVDGPQWGEWTVEVLNNSSGAESVPFDLAINSVIDVPAEYVVFDGAEPVRNADTLDLGTVVRADLDPELSLTIKNEGFVDVRIMDVHLPHPFVVTELPGQAIRPGSSAQLGIKMTTSSLGDFGGPVTVSLVSGTGRPSLFAFDLFGSVIEDSFGGTPLAPPSRPDLVATSDLGHQENDDVTNSPSLVFRGTARATSTLELMAGDTILGTTVVGRNRRWSVEVPTEFIGDGEHVFHARVRNSAGAVSLPSRGMSVVIDTEAPPPPVTPRLGSTSDTGRSSSDGIINLHEPELMGSTIAYGKVEIFDGAIHIATTYADSAGNWKLQGWTLTEGLHQVTARVMDAAGNISSPSESLVLNIDTTRPLAPATPDLDASFDAGPSNSDNITNQTRLFFAGTAEPNAMVRLYDGLTLLGTANVDALGAWSLQTNDLSSGSHTVFATVTDVAGNTSVPSSNLTVLVDTTPPAAPSLNLAAASDWGRSSADKLTSDATPTFTGIGERAGQVQLFHGTRPLGIADVNDAGVWTITTSALSEGVYDFSAVAIDQAGNNSALSPRVVVTIDLTPPATPTAPDLDPASDLGASSTDNITRDATPTFNGIATPNSLVQLFEGTRLLGSTISNAAGQWSITSTGLSNGQHTITVALQDAAGNTSAHSPPLNITVDTVAPPASVPDLAEASDRGISNSDNLTSETRPIIQGVTDPLNLVELFLSGQPLGSARADAVGRWSFNGHVFPDGTHSIVARAIDLAGNVGTVSPPLTITIDTVPPTSLASVQLDPSSDSGSSNSDGVTLHTKPSFRGWADPGSVVEVFNGATLLGMTAADASGFWSFTMEFAPGVHSIYARSTDAAGNRGAAAAPLLVTIDTSSPVAPSAPDLDPTSDGGVSSSDDLTHDTTPTLRGSSEPLAVVQIFREGMHIGSTVADAAGHWNFTTHVLGSGVHRFSARASDTAGNVSALSSELTIQIDAAAPVIDNLQLVRGAQGRITQIVLTFSEQISAANLDDFRLMQSRKSVGLRTVTIGDRTATLVLDKALSAKKVSRFRLHVNGDGLIMDGAGNQLDGDRDGISGGQAVLSLLSERVGGVAARVESRTALDALLVNGEISRWV